MKIFREQCYMKKWILCIVLIIANYRLPQNLWAGEINNKFADGNAFENEVKGLFNAIDFGNNTCLSYDVFYKAYIGYLNLKQAGKLNTDKEILTICDMSLPSVQNRMWIIDLKGKKLLCNTYVAHGCKTGEDKAAHFSNRTGSRMTSLGFYVTADTYEGEHGLSLHLQGMDTRFNDAAFRRGIVVHGASYVSNRHIAENAYLGRSWGCPAVPDDLSQQIIELIKDNTCLFIYYPDPNYLRRSIWLNKKVNSTNAVNFYTGGKTVKN